VRDPDELDREGTDGHLLTRFHRLEAIAGIDAVLLELRFDEGESHGRTVDRAVEQLDHVRNRTDVIFVSVGEDQRLHLVPA
jgi:hypothetical protein